MNMRLLTPTQEKSMERRKAFCQRIADQAAKLAASKEVRALSLTRHMRHRPEPEAALGHIPVGLPSWYFVMPPIETRPRSWPRIALIQETVARYFNIPRTELLSKRRFQKTVIPRQIAFYLCRELTPCGTPAIGDKFGGMDHTTVLHAIRKVNRLIREDSDFAFDIATLVEAIKGSQK